LLLGAREAAALPLRSERLVVEAAPRLGIVRGVGDLREVRLPPEPQDDLPVGERWLGWNQRASCQAPDATSA